MYINIHSHFSPVENEWTLQSIYRDFDRDMRPGFFSAGLHPWYLQRDYKEDMEKLWLLSASGAMLAFGECGLDKLCNTGFARQQTAFEQQVVYANARNKPLIIHCVRAYKEVLYTLEKSGNKVPVVFHGFNKSRELALQLTGKGYYLSFGKQIQKPAIQEYLPALPLAQIFFETDDAAIPVRNVYEWASAALGISTDDLVLQIKKNAENIFSIKL